MNKKKLYNDLSANTIQIGVTQFAGLIIFYLMSRFLSKEDFGEYGWASAIGITIVSIGSLGLDLVLVKRIAVGENAQVMSGVHFFHTIIMGLILLPALFLMQIVMPDFISYHPIFIIVVLQLTLTNIANSFKFSLSGLEAFKQLAIISISFNFFKLAIIVLLLVLNYFSIRYVVFGFIASALIEISLSYVYISKKLGQPLKPAYLKTTYKSFIKESLPQLAIVLFDSALARFDWILLGIFSSAVITGEYTFAFRFFELMKMPLLILAPVLFTRFSKLYSNNEKIEQEKISAIQKFFKLEIFISFIIPVVMVCCWSTLIDLITDNKYGAVNEKTFIILALCVPFQFVINLLWTMGVVQNQLKQIMLIIICTSILNIMANIILIPKFGSEGASISYLVSSIIQTILYYVIIKQERMKIRVSSLFLFGIWAILSIAISKYLFSNSYIAAGIALLIYVSGILGSRQISIFSIRTLK